MAFVRLLKEDMNAYRIFVSVGRSYREVVPLLLWSVPATEARSWLTMESGRDECLQA